MKQLLFITLFILVSSCSNEIDSFQKEYLSFQKDYSSKDAKVTTKAQYDSLKIWAKDSAKILVDNYEKTELSDTSLLKYADLLATSGEREKSISAYQKAFTEVAIVDGKWVGKYLDLLMEEDLSDPSVREKIDKTFTDYGGSLGKEKAKKLLYYGYYLNEKNISDDAAKAFDAVVAANQSKGLTGQAVLERSVIIFEQYGVKKALSYLNEQNKDHPENKMIREKITQFNLIEKKAPELEKVYLTGKGPGIKKLRGKVILLDFWAPWCGPCRRAFPELKENYKEFHNAGFTVIGATNYYPFYRDEKENIQNISHQDYDNKLKEFKDRFQLPWEILVADSRNNRDHYGVSFIPTFFLIDRKGIIRYVQVGSKENPDFLKNKIKELL